MNQTANDTPTLVRLVPETCYKCGIAFGMPSNFQESRKNDHVAFYCPNGHRQAYKGKSEAERLRENVKWQQRLARQEREEKEAAKRSLAATKGVLTRTKNRIAAGGCPCVIAS